MDKLKVKLTYENLKLKNPKWLVKIAKGNDCGGDPYIRTHQFDMGVNLEAEIEKVKGYYDSIESVEMIFDQDFH